MFVLVVKWRKSKHNCKNPTNVLITFVGFYIILLLFYLNKIIIYLITTLLTIIYFIQLNIYIFN